MNFESHAGACIATAGRAWRTPFGDFQQQQNEAGGPVAHAVLLQLPLDGPLQVQPIPCKCCSRANLRARAAKNCVTEY